MIFVTVGTHEQQFNRLLKYMDDLKKDNITEDEIIIQSGVSTYKPKYCKYRESYSYKEMDDFFSKARIVITHGGPSSFIGVLQKGKIPIVVPRKKKYGEHVNDHQKEFMGAISAQNGNIIVAQNYDELKNDLINYDKIILNMNADIKSNNLEFNKNFDKIVYELFSDKK